jgi:hypothetical protein
MLLLLQDSTHHNAVLVGVVLVLVLGGQAQAGPVVSLALQMEKGERRSAQCWQKSLLQDRRERTDCCCMLLLAC